MRRVKDAVSNNSVRPRLDGKRLAKATPWILFDIFRIFADQWGQTTRSSLIPFCKAPIYVVEERRWKQESWKQRGFLENMSIFAQNKYSHYDHDEILHQVSTQNLAPLAENDEFDPFQNGFDTEADPIISSHNNKQRSSSPEDQNSPQIVRRSTGSSPECSSDLGLDKKTS